MPEYHNARHGSEGNIFARYRNGLRLLEDATRNHEAHASAFSVHQQRLLENLDETEQYGNNDRRQSDRAEIIDRLNALARKVLGKSFNALCGILSVADAQQRLAEMPAGADDPLPAPSPLPTPHNTMPFTPNPFFVGRADALRVLATALKGGQTTVIGQIATVTGLGGIGKTSLAVEFVHRYGTFFAGVFWLSFDQPAAIPAEVAQCGGAGGMNLRPDFFTLPMEERVAAVRAAWHGDMPYLLVFDNCEDEQLLAQWRPTTGACRVLVTSRHTTWDASLGVNTCRLDVLTRAESIALLRKFRPNLPDTDADALAHELGDLPLALHLAGSYLRNYPDEPPSYYLKELQNDDLLEHWSLQEMDLPVSPTGHDWDVARTFALSIDELDRDDEIDDLAWKLLVRAAHFAPGEPVPREMLLLTIEEFSVGLQDMWGSDGCVESEKMDRLSRNIQDAANRLRHDFQDAVRRLVDDTGLLTTGADDTLVLHRLLAKHVCGLPQDEDDPYPHFSSEQALLQEVNRLLEKGDPRPLKKLEKHLWAAASAAYHRHDELAGSICNSMGYYLSMVADYPNAHIFYERALAITERVLGQAHPSTATSLNNLGYLLRDMGDLDGARPYLERALAIHERVLGQEHPYTATSLGNMAHLVEREGDYQQAAVLMRQALSIFLARLGPNHPDTRGTRQRLAKIEVQQREE